MKKTQEKQRANLPTLKKRKKPNESIRKMNTQSAPQVFNYTLNCYNHCVCMLSHFSSVQSLTCV